jgi:hypothetical protein
MKLLQFFKPKPAHPTIESYGQASCSVPPEQIQAIMEWLFASLIAAGYSKKSHVFWYNSDIPNPSHSSMVKKLVRRGEPIFLYRCGGRVEPPPDGHYWRMMGEHPSMRIYQLEVKNVE